MTQRNPKIGTVETVVELGNTLVGKVIGQKIKDRGKVVDTVAWRKFKFTTPDSDGIGINILLHTGQGMVEVTVFGEAVDAFIDRVFFDPENFGWVEFIAPNIGDYVLLRGVHTRKWKKLTRSSNPALKKGFWAPGFRVLDPVDIQVRPRPEKPSLEEVRTRNAAAKRTKAI
jgi:hypothetical protein